MLEARQEDKVHLMEVWKLQLIEHSLGTYQLQGIVGAAVGEGAMLTT